MGLLAAATLGLLVACEHTDQVSPASTASAGADPVRVARSEPRAGVTSMQAPAPGTAASVVERMARARCTREQICGNVGAGRAFADSDGCVEFMRGSVRDALQTADCALGVDQFALDDCLVAMDEEGCGDGVAVLRRARRCRADALCVK